VNAIGGFFVIILVMDEYYFSQAIVLDREPANEIDNRFHIYAKGYGKIVARGKSTRKITSKLSGHLEPGNIVMARLIEKNGLQVVDALKISHLRTRISDLYYLNKLLPEGDFDFQIWSELVGGPSALRQNSGQVVSWRKPLNWKKMLRVLGWDPAHGMCEVCGGSKVIKFVIDGQVFSCKECDFNLTNFVSLV